jgi:hypothetical protein
MNKKRRFNDGGIYTADMGQPPSEPDGGSAPMKKPMPKPPMAMKKPMLKKPMPPVKRPIAVDRSMDEMSGGRGATPMPGAMKKGGKVGGALKRADGCATKGKTKGAQIKMKRGGKC